MTLIHVLEHAHECIIFIWTARLKSFIFLIFWQFIKIWPTVVASVCCAAAAVAFGACCWLCLFGTAARRRKEKKKVNAANMESENVATKLQSGNE